MAVNIIAEPDWDEARFAVIREWALSVPEIVNVSVNTPYPGTETFLTEGARLTTRDYRLFDIQHAVLPTRLPLARFYEELVRTQQVLNRKHLGWAASEARPPSRPGCSRGQTNFVRSLWKFTPCLQRRAPARRPRRPVAYEMRLPPRFGTVRPSKATLYVHAPAQPA